MDTSKGDSNEYDRYDGFTRSDDRNNWCEKHDGYDNYIQIIQ